MNIKDIREYSIEKNANSMHIRSIRDIDEYEYHE